MRGGRIWLHFREMEVGPKCSGAGCVRDDGEDYVMCLL